MERTNRNNNTNGNKKPFKRSYVEPTKVNLLVYHKDELANDIYEVIEKTLFDKISISVSALSSAIYGDSENGKDKAIVVGYIRSYDKESQTFDIVFFNKYKNLANKKLYISPMVTKTNKDGVFRLKTIIRFNIFIEDEKSED